MWQISVAVTHMVQNGSGPLVLRVCVGPDADRVESPWPRESL